VLLWTEYLNYAASIGATKKWRRIMTRAVRMHPTNSDLWATAGRRAAASGDMVGARAMFMRGCRFCTKNEVLWVAYARMEMEWLAKVQEKKGSKGLKYVLGAEASESDGNIRFDDDNDNDDEEDFGDEAVIGDPLAEVSKQKPEIFDQAAAEELEKSPALDGAIPRAIFDICKKQAFFTPSAAESFFDMLSDFPQVRTQSKIVAHILASLVASDPFHPATLNCQIRKPLMGVDRTSPAFPKALRESIVKLREALATTTDRSTLETKTLDWIRPLLADEELDEGLRAVLEHTQRQLNAS
jgi:U3 small nucleolar RNA-associated protein 6